MGSVFRMVIGFLPCRLNDPGYPDHQAVCAASGWGIVAKSITGDLCRVRLAVRAFPLVIRFLPGRLNEVGDPDGHPVSAASGRKSR